jgi:hypothetical protein
VIVEHDEYLVRRQHYVYGVLDVAHDLARAVVQWYVHLNWRYVHAQQRRDGVYSLLHTDGLLSVKRTHRGINLYEDVEEAVRREVLSRRLLPYLAQRWARRRLAHVDGS